MPGPSSLAAIGYSLEHDGKTPDPANHEYGLHDFYAAVKAGNFPAVSFVKLPALSRTAMPAIPIRWTSRKARCS